MRRDRFSVLFVLAALLAPLQAEAQDIEVVLLGTGSPAPVLQRFGPSILVRANETVLLFDAGRGVMQRPFERGTGYDELNAVFLTHLHSDHLVGLPDLWLTGWLITGRAGPLRVIGPIGTADMVSHLANAFAFDIARRVEDAGVPREGARLDAMSLGRAFRGSRLSEDFIAKAAGVDLLIHEVAEADESFLAANPRFGRVIAHHTTAAEAGIVFARVRPKLAVYSHLVLPGVALEELLRRTRVNYQGALVVGEDRMRFVVGAEVVVHNR